MLTNHLPEVTEPPHDNAPLLDQRHDNGNGLSDNQVKIASRRFSDGSSSSSVPRFRLGTVKALPT